MIIQVAEHLRPLAARVAPLLAVGQTDAMTSRTSTVVTITPAGV
jgi:hypothetical protein